MFARVRTSALSIALLTCLLGLVCLRSWVVMVYPHAHMDADQAVFGLMAKDFAAGRPFSFFMYGQRYMLAVGSWLCAPLFLLFGPSVTTLKLPMFAMNVACVCMLWVGLRRESSVGRISNWGTALSILPFAATSVVVATRLVEHQGGNIEPFFFVLLAYFVRNRPVVLGLVFGVAFLNREFALSGFLAILIADITQGEVRARWKGRLISIATIALLSWGVRTIASYNPEYRGVVAVAEPQNIVEGFAGFLSQQVPIMFGSQRVALRSFNVMSSLVVGHDWLSYVVALWAVVVLVGLLRVRRGDVGSFPIYLTLVGCGQVAAFVLLCNAPREPMLLRYVVLALIAVVGLSANAWREPRLRLVLAAILLILCASNAWDNVRLVREYARHRAPRHEDEELAVALLERGVHYAIADYWIAYDVSWLTNERVIISPPHGRADRVDRYHEVLEAHANEVVVISNRPCKHGQPILRFFLCPAPRRRPL